MTQITPKNAEQIIGQHMLTEILPLIFDLEKSKGTRIFDSRDGKTYLDCFTFIASQPIGHNHPKLFDSEFEKKLLRAARTKPSNSDIYTTEMAEFVDTLDRLVIPKELPHLFLVDGGTLAVENGLKTAFDWKVRLNQKRGLPGEKGHQVIHFREAFHGRSGYTLSLTNTSDPRKYKHFPQFSWPRIINPKLRFPFTAEVESEVIAAEKQAIAEIKQAFAANPNDIAAILIEPIQGEGGDNQFRAEFHQTLRQLADENEAMLIYDEVQTGVGLTGKMWCYQHYGMTPDIVCFGKKMQVCGIMVSRRVEQVENHCFQEKSRINSTWGGNLVDMVRAQRYLEIIEEEKLVENAAKVGAFLQKSLSNLAEKFPTLISNVRGKGLLCAFDVSSVEKRDAMKLETWKRGALVLGCGVQSMRLRPALTFSEAEVTELVSIMEEAAKAVS